MKDINIKGPSGLGDAIYMYPVCKHYKEKGYHVRIYSKFPEIFDKLNCEVVGRSGELKRFDIECNYVRRKQEQGTNQYKDVLILSKITEDIELTIDYDRSKVSDDIKKVLPDKYCVVGGINFFLKRYCSFSIDMDFMTRVFDKIWHKLSTVQVGKDCFDGFAVNVNLVDKTTIYDLLYIVENASLVFGKVGYLLPMAEAFNKKVISVIPSVYKMGDLFLRTITPKKVKTKETSLVIYDDEPIEVVQELIGSFR